MSRYIPDAVRALVARRAGHCCEYCLIHEDDMWYTFWVDHIISIKHGGASGPENLAYACSVCNQSKGTDLGTYLSGSNRLIRLFHPRRDRWNVHFVLMEGRITPLTKIGEATVKVLDLNNPDRVMLRQALMAMGRYPAT